MNSFEFWFKSTFKSQKLLQSMFLDFSEKAPTTVDVF